MTGRPDWMTDEHEQALANRVPLPGSAPVGFESLERILTKVVEDASDGLISFALVLAALERQMKAGLIDEERVAALLYTLEQVCREVDERGYVYEGEGAG